MKRVKYLFGIFLFLFIAITLGLALKFPNTSKLFFCLITQALPGPEHISRIRNDLQNQKGFIVMLVKHEKAAIKRFNETGDTLLVKKHIYKTPTSMFDIHTFHDFWEVWVRTDIVDGRPLTSFLVRLGLIKDPNAESFFSNQCNSRFCRTIMRSLLTIYNKMFDWGIFKPIRLNITEIDDTSTVSRQRVELNEWNEMVGRIHRQGKGKSFINFNGAKKLV